MENKIFQNKVELDRLKLQGDMLREYEQPIYQHIIDGRSGLKLLDIGCNNGQKTVKRFGGESFSHVIGVDYLEDMAQQAQRQYGNEVFSFYACDVAAPDFIQWLRKIMDDKGIEAFDVIHMSFLLMHLEDPGAVLTSLRSVLAPQGKLIMIEPDDTDSCFEPDEDGLYPEFVKVLSKDPYAGDRFFAGGLPRLLKKSGYTDIKLEHSGIRAEKMQQERKQAIFTVFCSYLPEDIPLLRQQEPDNPVYQACEEWVQIYFEKLRQKMLKKDTSICMGVKIYTCGL